jgi:hypothetical protein
MPPQQDYRPGNPVVRIRPDDLEYINARVEAVGGTSADELARIIEEVRRLRHDFGRGGNPRFAVKSTGHGKISISGAEQKIFGVIHWLYRNRKQPPAVLEVMLRELVDTAGGNFDKIEPLELETGTAEHDAGSDREHHTGRRGAKGD